MRGAISYEFELSIPQTHCAKAERLVRKMAQRVGLVLSMKDSLISTPGVANLLTMTRTAHRG